VTRGADGSTPAAHTSGAAVPYFVDADEVITYIVAHESGHNCNIDHDTLASQMMVIRPGQTNLGHAFRKTGSPTTGSTQEFSVK